MRWIAPTIILAAALAATACTTSREPSPNSYAAREEALAADCKARGGILVPTGGATTRPEEDNVCRISGAALSRLRSD